jgi:hypothetical protein
MEDKVHIYQTGVDKEGAPMKAFVAELYGAFIEIPASPAIVEVKNPFAGTTSPYADVTNKAFAEALVEHYPHRGLVIRPTEADLKAIEAASDDVLAEAFKGHPAETASAVDLDKPLPEIGGEAPKPPEG